MPDDEVSREDKDRIEFHRICQDQRILFGMKLHRDYLMGQVATYSRMIAKTQARIDQYARDHPERVDTSEG